MPPTKPAPPPLHVDTARVVLAGTAVWAVALVVLLLMGDRVVVLKGRPSTVTVTHFPFTVGLVATHASATAWVAACTCGAVMTLSGTPFKQG